MPRRRSFAIAVAVAATLLVGLVRTAFAFPALPAIACPQCYGFRNVSPGVWTQGTVVAMQDARLSAMVEDARERVSSFYGSRTGTPRVLVCGDDACFRKRGGGGARAITILDVGLIVSPRGIDPVIVRHELSHAELHAELGLLKTVVRAVPQWFDEGLAVNVSDDPRYLASTSRSDRCLVEPAGDLPTDRTAWIHGASNDLLYAKAGCVVSRWLNGADGPDRVRSFVRLLKAGRTFDEAFRMAGQQPR